MLSKVKEAAAMAAIDEAITHRYLDSTEPNSPSASIISDITEQNDEGQASSNQNMNQDSQNDSNNNNHHKSKNLESTNIDNDDEHDHEQAIQEDDDHYDNEIQQRATSNLNNTQRSRAQQANKRATQDELINIVENSRKRRLSKDSADSLSSFIRHSFLDHQNQLKRSLAGGFNLASFHPNKKQATSTIVEQNNNNINNRGDENDSESNQQQQQWSALNVFNSMRRAPSSSDLLALSSGVNNKQTTPNVALNGNKRARMQAYSPEIKPVVAVNGNRSKNYLGNVVERLHQQQQQQQQQQRHSVEADQQQTPQQQISLQLQQFLASQQTSTSMPDVDNQQQLVLAAALQSALAEQQQQRNETSSLGALSQQRRVQQQQRHAQAAAALSALASAAGSQPQNNLSNHLLGNQQNQHLNANHLSHQNHHQKLHHPLGINQRSALAMGVPTGAFPAAAAAAAAAALNPAASHLAGLAAATSGANPLVDFKCDTCGSSFDDRHRLMQHQSIHLELKKDWFQETPVDEVMKIFNRRRGEFLCNLCNLRFEATLDFDQHNHQVHGPRPYCCQFCGNGTRTFKCWRQYLNHLYDHRYIFSCTIGDCDFTVNRRDSLRFHIFRFHLNCQLPTTNAQQQTNTNQSNQGNQGNNNNLNRTSTSSASSSSPSSSPSSSSFSSTNGQHLNNMLNSLNSLQVAQQAAAAFNLNFGNHHHNLLNSPQFDEHFGATSAGLFQQQAAAATKWHQQSALFKSRLQQQQQQVAAFPDDDTDNEMNVAD